MHMPVSHGTERTNRSLLGIIVQALDRYPSEIPLSTSGADGQELLGQVLDLLAQEGVVRITAKSVRLTRSGYAGVKQASRNDRRLPGFLQGASLPVEESGISSLVLGYPSCSL